MQAIDPQSIILLNRGYKSGGSEVLFSQESPASRAMLLTSKSFNPLGKIEHVKEAVTSRGTCTESPNASVISLLTESRSTHNLLHGSILPAFQLTNIT